MEQLQAGYFLEAVIGMYTDNDMKLKGLMNKLSFFDVDFTHNTTPIAIDEKVENTARLGLNILSRGLPTFSTIEIENLFAKIFLKTKKISDEKNIRYDFKSTHSYFDDLKDTIFKALHTIDPRLGKDDMVVPDNTWENLQGGFERDFVQLVVPGFTKEYAVQLFHFARPFNSLIGTKDTEKQEGVDFSLELPYLINNKRGMVIEIDGTVHRNVNQRKIDVVRDEKLENNNWGKTLRITTEEGFQEISTHIRPLLEFLDNEYYKTLSLNYDFPLYEDEKGFDALELALSPLAIGRIKAVLLRTLQKGMLDINAKKWEIAVIERDVPCGFAAIRDFKYFFRHLLSLFGGIQMPKIEVEVFHSPEFLFSKLNAAYLNDIKTISEFDVEKQYDLIIDISVLQNSNSKHQIKSDKQNVVVVRSALSRLVSRNIQLIDKDTFAPIFNDKGVENPDVKKSLVYVLKNTLRKNTFFDSQLKLIDRLVKGQNLLAIQPSNSGKTLSYQFASILCGKPVLAVVAEKVLALDQQKKLLQKSIDVSYGSNHLSSEYHDFVYVLPASLRNASFVSAISNRFAMIVFDEAHCISEWSHDFRSELSGIGSVIAQLNETPPQLIAFTSTASHDVVKNICTELNITKKETLRLTAFDRPELAYNIIKVETYLPDSKAGKDVILSLTASQKQITAQNILQKSTKQHKVEIVNMNMPSSVGELVQLAGKGGRDGEKSNFNILFSKISNLDKKEQKPSDNINYQQAFEKIQDKFQGRDKEIRIINELLEQISFPEKCEADLLEKQLFNHFSKKIELNFYPEGFPYNLHLHIDQQHFGEIYYPGAKITYDENYPDEKFSGEIVNHVIKYLENNCPENELPLKWLSAVNKTRNRPGIAALLQNSVIGENRNASIDFRNDAIEQIVEILKHSDIEAATRDVLNLYHSNKDFDKFYDALKKLYFGIKPEIDENIVNRIEFLYNSVRTEKETLVALHRLYLAGIIDNYSVDYANEKISIKLIRQETKYYYNHLENWFNQFVSVNKTAEYIQKIRKAGDFFFALVQITVDFIYNEVEKKHRKSLYDVYRICAKGVSTQLPKKYNTEIKDFISLYFDACYANRTISPSLYRDTKNLTLFNYKIVLKYITTVGYNRDNWQHLQASCRKLLRKKAKNYVFVLLEAYTDLLLNSQNVDKVCNAIDRIIDSFVVMRRIEKLSADQHIKYLKLFFEKIFNQDSLIKPHVEPLATAKIHNHWLSVFKAKFLEGYGK